MLNWRAEDPDSRSPTTKLCSLGQFPNFSESQSPSETSGPCPPHKVVTPKGSWASTLHLTKGPTDGRGRYWIGRILLRLP